MNLFRQTPIPAFLWPPRGYKRGGLVRETRATSTVNLWPPARDNPTYVMAYLTRRNCGRLAGEFEATSQAAIRLPHRCGSLSRACSNSLFRQIRPFPDSKTVPITVGA